MVQEQFATVNNKISNHRYSAPVEPTTIMGNLPRRDMETNKKPANNRCHNTMMVKADNAETESPD
jgi:hypothetical protein